MCPSVFGDFRDAPRQVWGGRAQRNHVDGMFGGLNRRGQLVAVYAAGLDAAFRSH